MLLDFITKAAEVLPSLTNAANVVAEVSLEALKGVAEPTQLLGFYDDFFLSVDL